MQAEGHTANNRKAAPVRRRGKKIQRQTEETEETEGGEDTLVCVFSSMFPQTRKNGEKREAVLKMAPLLTGSI